MEKERTVMALPGKGKVLFPAKSAESRGREVKYSHILVGG